MGSILYWVAVEVKGEGEIEGDMKVGSMKGIDGRYTLGDLCIPVFICKLASRDILAFILLLGFMT